MLGTEQLRITQGWWLRTTMGYSSHLRFTIATEFLFQSQGIRGIYNCVIPK